MTRVNLENKFACVTTPPRDLFTRDVACVVVRRVTMVVRCVVPRVNVDARCADAVAGAARKRDMTTRRSFVQSSVRFARGCARVGVRRRVRKVPSATIVTSCLSSLTVYTYVLLDLKMRVFFRTARHTRTRAWDRID